MTLMTLMTLMTEQVASQRSVHSQVAWAPQVDRSQEQEPLLDEREQRYPTHTSHNNISLSMLRHSVRSARSAYNNPNSARSMRTDFSRVA